MVKNHRLAIQRLLYRYKESIEKWLGFAINAKRGNLVATIVATNGEKETDCRDAVVAFTVMVTLPIALSYTNTAVKNVSVAFPILTN